MITVWIFYQILAVLYGLVSTVIEFLLSMIDLPLSFRVPANLLGVVLTLALVLLVGLLFETFLGKMFRRALDSLVRRIPFVSSIYDVFQQLANAVFAKSDAFSSPVLVPFPHPGTRTIGFATGAAEADLAVYFDGPVTKVFVPTTPIPTAGFLILYPSAMVENCGLTREEALTTILSGGIMEGGIASGTLVEEKKKNPLGKVGSTVFKGLLVLLPLFVTVYITLQIFVTLYDFFDIGSSFIPPESLSIFGPVVVAATFLATILFIWLVGILVRSFLGKQARRIFHGALRKIPPVDSIYTTLRQLVKAIMKHRARTDARVVLADFPFKGVRVIGFSTGKAVRRFGDSEGGDGLHKIFIPGTPNPTAGFFILAGKEDFVETSLTAEQGLKIALSGGILKSDASSGN